MSKLFATKLCAVAFAISFAAHANAQLTRYRFTGSVTDNDVSYPPHPALGTTISGFVTIDEGATAVPLNDTELVVRYGGNAIEFETDTGISGASVNEDGTTLAIDLDFPDGNYLIGTYLNLQSVYFERSNPPGDTATPHLQSLGVYGLYNDLQNNGTAPLTNWQPTSADESYILLDYNNPGSMQGIATSKFNLVSFERLPTTIVINGAHTGIADFEYMGQSVSALLNDLAADSVDYALNESRLVQVAQMLKRFRIINEGQYQQVVQQVTYSYFSSNLSSLANRMRRAGLLTRSEARDFVDSANQAFRDSLWTVPVPVS